jgi:hypothetical protein
MAGHGRKDVDNLLLETLAAGGSIASAARRAKVSEQTVRRRLANRDFAAKVMALRSQYLTDAIGRLSAAAAAASDELYRIVRHGQNDQVKLTAARSILTLALDGHEHLLLAAQVGELQRQIDELTRDASCRGNASENLP